MNNIPRIGDKIVNGKLVRNTVVPSHDISEIQTTQLNPPVVEQENVIQSIENEISSNNVAEQPAVVNNSVENSEPVSTVADSEYSISQFKRDYEIKLVRDVLPILKTYESERKKRLVGACAASGFLGLLAAIDLFFFGDADKQGHIFQGLCAATVGVWFWIKKSFEKKIKRKVMPILMKAIPDFSWEEKPPVTKEDMHDAKIFPLIPKCSVKSDDCFKGKYRDVNINITECEFTYNNKRTVFKGAVIKIDMNKNFEGTTVIRPKKEIEFKYIKEPGFY